MADPITYGAVDPTGSGGLDTLANGLEAKAATKVSLHTDIQGFDPGSHLPEAAKMGQKAHDDYLHGDIEPDAIEKDGKRINPARHAFNKFKEGGWAGGSTMALFGGVLGSFTFGMTQLLNSIATTSVIAGETVATVAGLSVGTLAMPLAIIATGIAWYGGKAAIQAYQDAKEHNHVVEEIEKGEAPGLDVAAGKSEAIDNTLPEKEIAAVVAAPVVMVADPSIVAAQANQEQAARPEFLQKILSDGPKSLSPKELAAQIEAERNSAEQSL